MLKKKYRAVAVVLAVGTIMSGCSVSEIPSVKDMMIGENKYEMDYDPVESVTMPDYKGIEVDCTVSDDEIQEEIESLLEANKQQEKIEKGTCKNGDTVNIDYSGKKDGKKFDGGTAEDQTITLGSSSMIDGFDDAIIGMKVGEKKDAKMKFPEDYRDESLAGEEVVFTIKVNYISKDIPLTLDDFDDDFVAKNTDYQSVATYKDGTRRTLAEEKKEQAGYTVFQELMKEAKVVNTPQSLHDKWETIANNELESQAQMYNMKVDELMPYIGYQDKETYLKEIVEGQVKQELMVESIFEQEGLKISEKDVKDEIGVACEQTGKSESDYRAEFEEYYKGAQTLDDFILFNLKAKKVLEILKDNAKIKE